MLSSLNYRRVQPTQAHTRASFANSLEFAWSLSSNEVMIWDDSYLSITFEVEYTADGAAPAAIPQTVGLSNAPIHTVFSDASLRVNNKEVSRLNDYSQSATIHQLLTQSAQRQDNNSSSNPISLERRWCQAGGLDETEAIARTRRSLGVIATGDDAVPPTTTQTFTVSARLPLWLTKEEVDGNTSFIARLVVDNSWRNRLLRGPAADVVAVGPLSSLGAGAVAKSLLLDVTEMTLNLRTYESSTVPRSIVKSYGYSEIFSSTRAITNNAGSQRYTFTMPRVVSSVFFTFFDSRQGSASGLYAPSRFICDASKALSGYEVRYAGTTVPSPKHILSLADANANRGENNEAFSGFIRETMDLSPNGSQFSAVEWASQPIFYHQVIKPSGSEAPECSLELNFATAPGAESILYFAGFSPQEVEISYNDTGLVNDVSISVIE